MQFFIKVENVSSKSDRSRTKYEGAGTFERREKIVKFGTKKILVMIGIGMLALVFWEIFEATGTEIFDLLPYS